MIFKRYLSLVIAAFVLGACQGPSVFVLHSPMQPTNAQTVTYTANAVDSDGVSSIEIWEDRNTLSLCNNVQCANHVSTSLLRTCNFSPAQTNATCSFTTTAGYPDSSFIGYRAVARDSQNKNGSEGWIYYAAGAFPWPNNPIPIYGKGAPAEKVDMIFMPDPDFNGNNVNFINAVSGLVGNGYLSSQPFATNVRTWRGFWNLYVTYQTADAQGFGNGCNTQPTNWTTLRTIVDAGAIVHVNNLRDCGQRPPGGIFSVMVGANQTALHETGHTVFDLADEYCCDGGYWTASPHGNMFSSQSTCQSSATSHGWPTTDCAQLAGPNCGGGTASTWWRSDGGNDLMQCGNTYGRADDARIFWLYFEQCNGTSGC